LIDSQFNGVSSAIVTPILHDHAPGVPSISLDNVVFQNVSIAIQDVAGDIILPGDVGFVRSYTIGNVYAGEFEGQFFEGYAQDHTRNANLTGYHPEGFPMAEYFSQSMPQYAGLSASAIVQAKWIAKGR
jgi:hypothetical protein